MNINHIKLSGLILLTGALAVSTNLYAGESDKKQLFQALDSNSDKMISAQELTVAKRLARDFNKYDANKNGTIDENEFSSFLSAAAFTPVEEEDEPIGAAPTQ